MQPELVKVITIVSNFGIAGIVFVIWYFDQKASAKQREEYQKSQDKILTQYRKDMTEQRRMYESNAELVKRYADTADDLKEVIIMNTTAMTKVCEKIDTNQFCPMVKTNSQEGGGNGE